MATLCDKGYSHQPRRLRRARHACRAGKGHGAAVGAQDPRRLRRDCQDRRAGKRHGAGVRAQEPRLLRRDLDRRLLFGEIAKLALRNNGDALEYVPKNHFDYIKLARLAMYAKVGNLHEYESDDLYD